MQRSYRLYVIALDPAVHKERLFRKENPHGGSQCFYVGSTAHTPEQRFAQHITGKFSTRRWVQKYGIELVPQLAGTTVFATREAAEQAERDLAAHLRRQGFAVWSR
jgi:predicted GIY-YIG superfamily endonuclease